MFLITFEPVAFINFLSYNLLDKLANYSQMKKIIFILAVCAFSFQSCKKDKVEEVKIEIDKIPLDQSKRFSQIDPIPVHPMSSWYLVLRVDGSAAIAPGMDTMINGTYKIVGNLLTVKINQEFSYEFEILSETDIKLKGDNVVVLRLQIKK